MCIIIVDDQPRFAALLASGLATSGDDVQAFTSPIEALDCATRRRPDFVLSDLRMPGLDGLEFLRRLQTISGGCPVALMTAFADIDSARQAMHLGVLDYLVKPFPISEAERVITSARSRVVPTAQADGLIGDSPGMRRLKDQILRIARCDATVLIQGQTGTGKELVARAIHLQSARAKKPFVEIHCGALNDQVIESEFFGHEKGAFTGAHATHVGLLEQADGGTAFLDEIGEMPLNAQVKLLRALQERRFYRVGGRAPISVDIRVIAATHRDLHAQVAAGAFREDLLYRLNVVPLQVPSLDERREDIIPIARYFAHQHETRLTPEAEAALLARTWPGNVRELANVIERAAIFSDQGLIYEHAFPASGTAGATATSAVSLIAPVPSGLMAASEPSTLADTERQAIMQAIARAAGNRTHAAALLGITRRRLYSRMRVLGMSDHG